ncbi:glycosyltransferase family 4 protein [bacterium]|nr:glycosyltransferase family 4 protein [bacterium]
MGIILILTTEPLPLPGMPTSGAGLRAWGLAMGLRAAGLDVRLLAPEESTATYGGKSEIRNPKSETEFDWVKFFRRAQIREAVRAEKPDAIVLQHWGLAAELGEVDCPLAIDLAGPHLLERRLWGSDHPEADLREKLDALRRADFLTCSGERQRLYFLPFLSMAGWPIEEADALPVIPFSMAPAREPAPPRPDRLIYGGYMLPWQDPTLALETALETMDELGKGELLFVGGQHPSLDVSRGRFESLLEKLDLHPRVRRIGPMPFDDYLALLAEGGVALDLMARNAERELAFTTRTVVYLAAGLPVIHDNYSELGDLIAKTGDGWAIDPADRMTLRSHLIKILSGEYNLVARGQAALETVRDHLHWDHTARPLADWCRAPQFREGKMAGRLAFEEQGRRIAGLEKELEEAKRDLNTLRGKRWVRWGLELTSAQGWLRWPMALLATIIGVVLFPIFWVNDRLARR